MFKHSLYTSHFKFLILTFLITVLSACGSDTNTDNTPPIITIIGGNPLTVIQGDNYIDEGATANDDVDGEVAVSINGSVDTSTLGEHTITYTAMDKANNIATSIRIVSILTADITPPTLTLIGEPSLNLFINDSYVEQGAIATDNRDSDLNIIITGSINTAVEGDYLITYLVTDSSGNSSSVTRLISITLPDTTPPVITLNGASSIRLLLNDTYVEEGATATDNLDPTVEITTTENIDNSTVGEYIVTYTAIDNSGNSSSIVRTISVEPPKPFITTWNTNIESEDEEENRQVTIFTHGEGYNYQISWGDGLVDENITGDITHTYATAGTYTVSINGHFPQIINNSINENKKLKSIEQWGDIKWLSMRRAFYKTSDLAVNATDSPDLSRVSDMSAMFSGVNGFSAVQEHWDWDVATVTKMDSLFSFNGGFNQNISNWNVSSVTDMDNMFSNALSFNQALSNWNVSSVTTMRYMFDNAALFDQDISNWNVSSVTDMQGMFWDARSFNQHIGKWHTVSVTDMGAMFYGAVLFNQNISDWDVSSVTDTNYMFEGASNFNQNLNTWNVSSVTNMKQMFKKAKTFNGKVSDWDVSSVTDMSDMFRNATAFNQNLNNWNTTSVTMLSYMFSEATSFNGDISDWKVSSVKDMSFMFHEAESFNQDISMWNVSSVENMGHMFKNARSFNQDIGNWNVSSVNDVASMFSCVPPEFSLPIGCVFDQNLGSWDISLITGWNFTGFLSGQKLSVENYDAMLIGWSQLNVQENVSLYGGYSKYSNASVSAREVLRETFSWSFIDRGLEP